MIEAIKSTLVSAPSALKSAIQSSDSRSSLNVTADVEQTVVDTADSFYFSRKVRVDSGSKIAVLEFRNPLNGDVKTQIPTEAQLQAYEKEQLRADKATLVSYA